MTIQEAKDKLVSWLNDQVGYREGTNNWNKYADIEGISRLYGWYPQNQPWCDIFADAAYICCFGYDLASAMTYQLTGMGSALCKASASFYKQHNAWYNTPEVGDQVFFYSGGDINHTGIVTGVSGNTVTTVEGNSSDMVARRTYTIGSSYIAGYGRPMWSAVTGYDPPDDEDTPEPPPDPYRYHDYQYTVKIHLLKLGDFGPQVKSVQAMLNAHGFVCTINGTYDDATYSAVKAFQEANGLEDDGEFGGITFDTLYNSIA